MYGVNDDVVVTSTSRSVKKRRGRLAGAPCRRFTGATLAAAVICDSMQSAEAVPEGARTSIGGNEGPGTYDIFMKCMTYIMIIILTIRGVRVYDRIVDQIVQSARQFRGTQTDTEIDGQENPEETRTVGSQSQCTLVRGLTTNTLFLVLPDYAQGWTLT